MSVWTTTVAPTVPVAAEIVRRQLHQLGLTEQAAAVHWDVDWAGPVPLPLADEASVQAACGIMHVHGRRFGRPEPLAVDYASAMAGILAGQGILAALIARARGRRLSRVRTSVAQAALLAMTQYLAAATCTDGPQAGWSSWGETGGPPFRSADGVLFEIEMFDAEIWLRFWCGLGAEEQAIRRGWRPFLLRFATATCPVPCGLHEAAARHRFAEVSATGAACGASVVRVRQSPDGVGDRRPWLISPLPGTTRRRFDRPRHLPLEGIVVVESTRRLQGPLASHLLRLLGAEVVRIEPPGGDPQRGEPPIARDHSARFRALNDGKRVVEADFTTRSGVETIRELVAAADVFLHNWAPGKAARLGLDSARLARVRPGLVYASASGWGDALGAHPPLGTDYLVQAYSGLAAAIRPQDATSTPSLMTVTDILGGLVSAQGILAALLHRIRTGRGSTVDSSLLSASGVLPHTNVRPVWTELDRPLRTADGYLMLSRRSAQQSARVHAALARGRKPALLAARLRSAPSSEWRRRLADAGLSAVEVCTDLRTLAGDRTFSAVTTVDDYVRVLPPWEFT
jgi:crotonobetainyl-CoA:carnitine CoA-transferase CaiB-like acyl-CoA transferase